VTAELHCHSYYSVDGWAAPEEMAEMAAAAGVTTLSLTDHNSVEGLGRCRRRAEELGLRFIDGIEIDAKWRGADCHLVGFGFDPGNAGLGELCARNWECYESNFALWAPIIERRWAVCAAELRAALPTRYGDRPSPPLNKWFARSYLFEKGVFADAETALAEMSSVAREAEEHLPPEEVWPFRPLEEARDAVHAAGGVLLLAHVGGSSPTLEGQLELIHGTLDAGLDGFELYHGANTRCGHFDELVAEARRLGCATSGGSDAHAHPTHSRGGVGRVPVPDWVLETVDAALARRKG
jgi:predicted metal-dependent phosphoesterase TrpH